MTTKKISELTELLTPSGDDYFVLVDSSANETKKIKMSLGVAGVTTHAMTTGQTTLTVGTELKDTPIEVIFLSAVAAETLSMINGSRDGHIKVIVATNNNVTVTRNDSCIKTKNPLAHPSINLNTGDVMALVNVDGKGQVATIEVKENSQLLFSELIIDEAMKKEKTLLDLAVGEILIKAQKVHGAESKFEVKTPTSIVGVRGTTFAVKVEALDE